MIKCSGFGSAITMTTSDFCQNCNFSSLSITSASTTARYLRMKSNASTTSAAKLLDIGCPKVIPEDSFLLHFLQNQSLLTILKYSFYNCFRRQNNPKVIFYL